MVCFCIQCAMEAMVKGEQYEPVDEDPAAHQQRVHGDLHATKARRTELETLLAPLIREQEKRREH